MPYTVKNQYGVVTVTEDGKPREIRFITPEYKELFRIPDGGNILFCKGKTKKRLICRYLDDYHFKIEGGSVYHICEFAEKVKAQGAYCVPFPRKRYIWSDLDLNLKDWIDDIYRDDPELDRSEYENRMYELNAEYLDDERENLNVKVGDILVIGDLGLWNGRHTGYKEIHDASLGDCLEYNNDGAEWYVDWTGEFCGKEVHHDGTNYYRYRTYKEGASEADKNKLKELIYTGQATNEDIDKLTDKLGFKVGEVYGWEFPTGEN